MVVDQKVMAPVVCVRRPRPEESQPTLNFWVLGQTPGATEAQNPFGDDTGWAYALRPWGWYGSGPAPLYGLRLITPSGQWRYHSRRRVQS